MVEPINADFLAGHDCRPTKRMLLKSGDVSLAFKAGARPAAGPWVMRGGIAWPRMVPDQGVMGYVLLAGRSGMSGEIRIFEESPFQTLDWLHAPTGLIDPSFIPLAPFLALCWHYYLSKRFAFLMPTWGFSDYAAECQRLSAVDPKPVLMALDPQRYADHLAVRVAVKDRSVLAYSPKSGLARAFAEYGADPQGKLPPALEALGCALVALDAVPVKS